jgi:hypothetical protein
MSANLSEGEINASTAIATHTESYGTFVENVQVTHSGFKSEEEKKLVRYVDCTGRLKGI